MSERNSQRRFFIGLMILAAVVRGGVLVAMSSRLQDDIDAYRGIARQLATGHGYSSPGSDLPTAYRPPLYPLLLAVALQLPGNWGIVLLHWALGLATVWLTWRLGQRLGLGRRAIWAAGLIAFDPLLLQYSTLPMTETLCACLAVWALNLMVPLPETSAKRFLFGFVLGLAVVSRPTFLVFAGLVFLAACFQSRKHLRKLAQLWPIAFGLVLAVAPWMIRNAVVFGEPRLTTTHGGYTLLLGNNLVFYEEVVKAPWGTTWQGDSLAEWQASLETEIRNADPPVTTEPERDRWMAARAKEIIARNPGLFLRACFLRFVRFWNFFPPESATNAVSNLWVTLCQKAKLPAWEKAAGAITRMLLVMVCLFYAAITIGFLMGLFRLTKTEWAVWWPLVAIIASFCLVHLVYWSNTRMRAPVMPAIALLAVHGWFGIFSRSRNEQ